MKHLFKLPVVSIWFFTIALLILASCTRNEFYKSDNTVKLERLSAELENRKNSIPSDLGSDALNKEEGVEYSPSGSNTTSVALKGNSFKRNKNSGIYKETQATKIKAIKNLVVRKETLKQETQAGKGGLSQRMKIGIILASIGLLVALLIPWPIYIIGLIVFIIGVVLIIMELVNY